MRYPVGHKEKTRERILEAAAKIFRRLGYHAAGVDAVMEEAGLTAGGFYAHFDSKEELLVEAMATASVGARAVMQPKAESLDDASGRAWIVGLFDNYLSPAHRDQPEIGCPLPPLISEVGRGAGPVKASFEGIVRDFAAGLRSQSGDDLTEERCLALVALCVGGVALARSVEDDELGVRILGACRDLARASLAAEPCPTDLGRKRA